MEWYILAQDRAQWRNTVKFQVPLKAVNFLKVRSTVSFQDGLSIMGLFSFSAFVCGNIFGTVCGDK
jgi:hypothetical protein